MLLTIDIGNTTTGVAFFKENTVEFFFSIKSNKGFTKEEIKTSFKLFLRENCIDFAAIQGSIISSVVPNLTPVWTEIVDELFSIKTLVVGPGIKTGIQLIVDNPAETGSDLICDLVGAKEIFGNSTLIVDLGTASKYLLLDKNGAFSGASITPGVKLSLRALTGGTSLLPEISLFVPKNVIGKNTKDCMNSGIFYGTIYQIEGFAKAYEEETGTKLNKILTGGYARLIKDKLPDFKYEEYLIFKGLASIYYKNCSK